MRNILLIFLLGIAPLYAQNKSSEKDYQHDLGPQWALDNVFDRFGHRYHLSELKIGTVKDTKTARIQPTTTLISCPTSSPSYFNLYFETGSGMESATDPTHILRREVICKVFQDISSFIISPLTGNGNKVNIWIRDINQVEPSPNGLLGLGTSFYNVPYNAAAGFGGIADGEIWKTIHRGIDSYTNVASPVTTTGTNTSQSGVFYHGLVAFNFNSNNNPAINWHTNMNAVAPTGFYDLYSVALHEVIHALGFASLINENGGSKFGSGFNYYSRYDTFLKNASGSQSLVLPNSSTYPMYNYYFTTNTGVLHPALANCTTTIKYTGSVTTPVYTPSTFAGPSSLHHFEDQCIGPPNANNINAYFVMTDETNSGVIKRYPKVEERAALCDMGYNVAGTFGSTVYQGTIDYGVRACSGINVSGINDGIASGTYAFVFDSGSFVNITGILSNDLNAAGFEGLKDIYDTNATINGVTTPLSGSASTTISYVSNVPGLHLLRYVPVNAVGQKGNITYVYVYVRNPPGSANCRPNVNACNLVNNGDFEYNENNLPTSMGQLSFACGWFTPNAPSGTPEYFHANSSASNVQVPCNAMGLQTDRIPSNKAYAGILMAQSLNGGSPFQEVLTTQLAYPLLPNTTYQLSFDASLAEAASGNAIKLQAFLSTSPVFQPTNADLSIPPANLNMLFTSPTITTITNGWERITFTVQTDNAGGQQFLYIGGLRNVVYDFNASRIVTDACSTYNWHTPNIAYYYIDNVQIVPVAASLNLPNSVCQSQVFSNLRNYVYPAPISGEFFGPGVSGTDASATFNATLAGLGTHTIEFRYTSNIGCVISIYTQVTVSACSAASCPGDLVFVTTEPSTSATYQAANSILTQTNYLVNSGTITFKAGNSITFTPTSEIKSGSNFTAKIEACTQTSNRVGEDDDDTIPIAESKIIVFPNPTNGMLTIESEIGLRQITLLAVDGKLVFDKATNLKNSYQVDISNYKKGLYILRIETNDGNHLSRKVMKN